VSIKRFVLTDKSKRKEHNRFEEKAKEKLHITSGGCAVRVVPCCDGFRLDTAGGSNGNGRIYSAAL
jgi:hypothetical protein